MALDGVAIRPLREGDEGSLRANLMSAISMEQVRAHTEWAARDSREGVFGYYVADAGGEVVGCVVLRPQDSLVRQEGDGTAVELIVQGSPPFPAGNLGGWVVSSRYQRLGIGRMLFEHVRDTARSWGMRRLMTSTMTSQEAALAAFYRFGFSEWGRLPLLEADNEEVFFFMPLDA